MKPEPSRYIDPGVSEKTGRARFRYRITLTEQVNRDWEWLVELVPGSGYVGSGLVRSRRKARKAAERAARNHATPFAGRTETYEVTL